MMQCVMKGWSSFLILGNVKYVGENIISKVCYFLKQKNPL